MDYQDIESSALSLNNAFFRLESFMDSNSENYTYFNFHQEFERFFIEVKKPENYNIRAKQLVNAYYDVCYDIRIHFDKSTFDNAHNAYANEEFIRSCNDIDSYYNNFLDDFYYFEGDIDWHASDKKKGSIMQELSFKASSEVIAPISKIIAAPVIALFCSLINESAILIKGEEITATYCNKICVLYKLPYTDRVRQSFSNSESRGNIQKVKEQILSKIDKADCKKITDYMNIKQPHKNNLYA